MIFFSDVNKVVGVKNNYIPKKHVDIDNGYKHNILKPTFFHEIYSIINKLDSNKGLGGIDLVPNYIIKLNASILSNLLVVV